MLEGSQLCRKESFSPDPESGEQWTKTQGARKPSTVLLADVCLSVCFFGSPCLCVLALSLVSFSSGASFSSL